MLGKNCNAKTPSTCTVNWDDKEIGPPKPEKSRTNWGKGESLARLTSAANKWLGEKGRCFNDNGKPCKRDKLEKQQ